MRLAAQVVVAASVLAVPACSDGNTGDLAAFCDAVADPERFEAVFDRFDPTDVDAARATFQRARDEQEALRDVAPSEPRRDIDVIVSFVEDLIEGLEPGRATDDQGRPSIYQSLRPRFDEVEAAGDRLRTYTETNC